LPNIKSVAGSNFIDIGAVVDEHVNRAIIISAEDNLIKGAAGQAVQNMNIIFDLDEREGLDAPPTFP
jgi:N-acetyl-gamma-glutamyl-phosphate reductase